MGLKHMAHALFSSNKDGKTASTSDGKTASTSDGKTASTSDGKTASTSDGKTAREVDEGSSSSDEDEFSRQQTHHENGDPPIITGIYEEASTEERKKKRVRGPTIGKAVVQMIKKNEGNRIPVVVLPEMRAFCGINASCVANEFGVQIRRICPTEGFAHSWNDVDSTVKEAIMQAIRDKFQITDEDIAEDSELIEVVSDEKAYKIYKYWKYAMRKHYVQMKEEGLDAFAHPYPGVTNAGWRYLIDNIFDDEKFEVPIKNGQNSVISGKGLIHLQRLARGLVRYAMRYMYVSSHLPTHLNLMPSVLHKNNKYKNYVVEIEESKKKDEERDQEIANLKILVAQLMNGGGGNNHSSCCSPESLTSFGKCLVNLLLAARECSSVPVPSNTWVLLVLNWKLGAGTSLAYLTAWSCSLEDGGLTYGLFLQVAETLASFVLIFFLLVADDLLKSTTIYKIPSDLEGMEDSMEKLLALVDGSYKLYVDDVGRNGR
ncbi:hypothetical protein Dimus_005412 [Dionaea muscipula]